MPDRLLLELSTTPESTLTVKYTVGPVTAASTRTLGYSVGVLAAAALFGQAGKVKVIPQAAGVFPARGALFGHASSPVIVKGSYLFLSPNVRRFAVAAPVLIALPWLAGPGAVAGAGKGVRITIF